MLPTTPARTKRKSIDKGGIPGEPVGGVALGDRLTRPRWLAMWLFCLLVIIYNANGDIVVGNDTKANTFMPISILKEGNLSFTPDEMPFMFLWEIYGPDQTYRAKIRSWDTKMGVYTFGEIRSRGRAQPVGNAYYIVPSRLEGVYVNTFGPAPGICYLPVAAILKMVAGDLQSHLRVLWYGAKFTGSVFVAGSAVFVFLAALGLTDKYKALFSALAYGLGTCVWSTSSQALWQHGPNEFFLAMGVYFLSRLGKGQSALLCGLALSAAFACRPTGIFFLAAVGVYLLITDRKALKSLVVGALPLLLAVVFYNYHYFGNFHTFGQSISPVLAHQVFELFSQLSSRPMEAAFHRAHRGIKHIGYFGVFHILAVPEQHDQPHLVVELFQCGGHHQLRLSRHDRSDGRFFASCCHLGRKRAGLRFPVGVRRVQRMECYPSAAPAMGNNQVRRDAKQPRVK